MFAKDFRKKAWQSLSGNWGIAILTYFLYLIVAAVASIIPFGSLLIAGPLAVGCASVYLSIARKEEASVGQLLDGTKNFVNSFLAYLLVILFTTLWMFLFIIPGIIKAFSYSMTFHILRDHPEMTATEAMKRSQEMMKGHKWQLFCLYFSYIGWFLLCSLTCGLLTFMVMPYMLQANTEFYRHLNGESDVQEQEEVIA